MSKITLDSLKSSVEDQVRDEFVDLMEDRYYSDRLHDIADGTVPIYSADRAAVLASEPGLEVQDLGLATGRSSIMDLIGIAIYEELTQEAHRVFAELKEKYEELKDDAESDGCEADRKVGKWCIFKLKDDSEDDEEANREYLVEGESSEIQAWIELFESEGNW